MVRVEEESRHWPRRAAALGTGALLAVALSLSRSTIQENDSLLAPPGVPAWWVADRDADAVYALDRERILALRVPIQRPIAVRSTSDGGAWIVRSTAATARGGRSLVRILPDGSIALETSVGGPLEPAVLDGDHALVIEDGDRPEDPRRLLMFDADGRRRVLLEEARLACAIGSGHVVFAGASDGVILRLDVENATPVIERAHVEGPIVALAAADSGSVYALRGGDGMCLARLDPDLSIAWSAPCGSRRAGLASTPDGEHAWIVDPEAQLLRKFDRAGALELERTLPPTGGISSWAASEEGGVVLATSGALLVFDEKGNARPGQGGFALLVDVDRIPGRR